MEASHEALQNAIKMAPPPKPAAPPEQTSARDGAAPAATKLLYERFLHEHQDEIARLNRERGELVRENGCLRVEREALVAEVGDLREENATLKGLLRQARGEDGGGGGGDGQPVAKKKKLVR